ncbi:hypothetical protein DB30_01349 [Enhygromyxa salina]|uniref:Uncharacterized protein n=2 Tax=Enhygromyxa salina TaxID=215803 RepID=A0A0C2D9I2_9BACT|nr:hypothetical protein DB30_01349 [Enhygromyxa salina]
MLVLGVGTRARAAAPPEQLDKQVALVVDVGALEVALGERLAGALDVQLREGLQQAGAVVVDDFLDAMIAVRIEMPNAELRLYAITVEVVVDGEREVVVDAEPCETCSEAQVVELAVGKLEAALGRVPAPEVVPEPEVVPVEPEEPRRRRGLDLGPLGIAGMSGAIVGAAASIGAGVLVLSLLPSQGEVSSETIDWTYLRVGGPVVIVGGVGALLGVAAVVLDTQVLRARRKGRADVHVSADVSASHAGFWITGRF